MALFPDSDPRPDRVDIEPGAVLLPRFALPWEENVRAALEGIVRDAPPRRMETPAGSMSVDMTSCGEVGWTSDRKGYRYSETDPRSGSPWPAMPRDWLDLAQRAAGAAGFPGFEPDSCLINSYAVGARMGLHQDRDERDPSHPVVSVSFGLPAVFLFGGAKRTDRARRVPLLHGDAIVWGGSVRGAFHGIAPLKAGVPTAFGTRRVNLTFRRAR
jgi:alkylated DNA repair protein (DNA oxidative demethylase)